MNSLLGVAASFVKTSRTKKTLQRIQRELFVLGSELSSKNPAESTRVTEEMVKSLENETDSIHEKLPRLANFILPGGSTGAAILHLSRAVARRTEREVVALSESEPVRAVILQYLNRLSSLLFELARLENYQAGRREEVWKGETRKSRC